MSSFDAATRADPAPNGDRGVSRLRPSTVEGHDAFDHTTSGTGCTSSSGGMIFTEDDRPTLEDLSAAQDRLRRAAAPCSGSARAGGRPRSCGRCRTIARTTSLSDSTNPARIATAAALSSAVFTAASCSSRQRLLIGIRPDAEASVALALADWSDRDRCGEPRDSDSCGTQAWIVDRRPSASSERRFGRTSRSWRINLALIAFALIYLLGSRIIGEVGELLGNEQTGSGFTHDLPRLRPGLCRNRGAPVTSGLSAWSDPRRAKAQTSSPARDPPSCHRHAEGVVPSTLRRCFARACARA